MKRAIFYAALLLILLFTVSFLLNRNKQLEKELKLKEDNICQIDRQFQDIKFEKGELENWIKQRDTEFKLKIDSISSDYKIRLSEIKKASQINFHYKTQKSDTVFVSTEAPAIVTSPLEDTLFHIPFSDTEKCYSIEGVVISKDSSSKISITGVEFTSEIISLDFAKRPKWWKFWKWFSKRKLESVTISTCGNIEVKQASQQN